METLLALLGVTKVALELINTRESKELFNRVTKLELEIHEELKLPEDNRSQLFLDERMLELTIIAKNTTSLPRKNG